MSRAQDLCLAIYGGDFQECTFEQLTVIKRVENIFLDLETENKRLQKERDSLYDDCKKWALEQDALRTGIKKILNEMEKLERMKGSRIDMIIKNVDALLEVK